MNDGEMRRHARHIAWTWLALIGLMLASLGSAYLPLGRGNAIAGIVIAAVKTGLVVALFMGLWRAQALLRIMAAVALGTWGLLLALGGLDYWSRPREPAVYQRPSQLEPWRPGGSG